MENDMRIEPLIFRSFDKAEMIPIVVTGAFVLTKCLRDALILVAKRK